jgi:membrane protease YdiL (CAAX protease family)
MTDPSTPDPSTTDPSTDPQPQLAALPDGTGSTLPSSPPTSSIPKPPFYQELFFGPEGLRSGWSFALYLALLVALSAGLRFLLHSPMHHLAGTLWQMLAQYVVLTSCALLPALAMSRMEKRPFGIYGLPARGAFGKTFAWGVVWGFAALSLLLVALRGFHAFYFGFIGVHGTKALKFAMFWAAFFLFVGFFEEFLFRGYTLFTLSRGISFWPAALALSTLFGYVHLGNPGESWRGGLSAGLIGLFFCFTVRRTGNLWFAVGCHASWDWAESYFYGVPDSGMMTQGHLLNSSFRGPAWLTGGTVGPEGSVLVFVVIAILFVAFHALHPASSMEARASSPVQV